MDKTSRRSIKGLRQFLDEEQQRDWMEGRGGVPDADERRSRSSSGSNMPPAFKSCFDARRHRKFSEILALYGETCLPVPRMTERYYWSVSCLPSTSDKPLVRVNASWMELFTLYADGDDIRSRFIVHLSDFTRDGSLVPGHVDNRFLEQCVGKPEDVGCFFPRGADIFGIRVRGSASIRRFLASPRALRAVRSSTSPT